MTNRTLKFLGILVAGIAALYLLNRAYGFVSSALLFKSPTGRRIQSVVTEAIKFDVDMTALPAIDIKVYGKPRPQGSKSIIPDRIWNEILHRDIAKAKKIFSPNSSLLATRIMLEKRDIAAARGSWGAVNLGGGIYGPVKFNRIQISGDTATVSCRATVWSGSSDVRSTSSYIFALQKDGNGLWQVISEDFTFAPGSEP